MAIVITSLALKGEGERKRKEKRRNLCVSLFFYTILTWLDRGSFALSAKDLNLPDSLSYYVHIIVIEVV
jgi:branched-subunit amino acid transport protein